VTFKQKIVPGAHFTADQFGPQEGLNALEKRLFLTFAGDRSPIRNCPNRSLVLVLTESFLVHHLMYVVAVLNGLHHLSVDD